MKKTNYQLSVEERTGRTVETMALEFAQAPCKRDYAKEINVPYETLANWARAHVRVKVTRTVRPKQPTAV